MRLDEVLLIFVAGDRIGDEGRTQAVSQVEQMRNSACYLRSDGRMGCLTCHDAHSVPKPEQRDEHYRQRCLTCHETKDCQLTEAERRKTQKQDSCSACHMPRLGAELLPHTSQTDHRIVRFPQELRQPTEQYRVEDYRLFDGAESRLPKWEVQRSRGLMLASMAEKNRLRKLSTEAERLLKPARQILDDDPDVAEALAVCMLLQKQDQAAAELLTQTLSQHPRRESLLLRLAYFSHDHGDLKKAAEYFSRLVEVNPSQADFHGRFAHILGRIGRLEQGIKEAERAVELNPTLSQAHAWLAEAYEAQGMTDRSAIHREKAAKLSQAGF
jgi:predicted CXXCH cytochrome family protein